MKYSKYGAKKVTVDGITFDSRDESKRYKELKAMLDEGKIDNLRMQVPYELIPKQVKVTPRYHKRTGERIKDEVRVLEQNCEYVADFVYRDLESGEEVVEDVKGYTDSTAYAVYVVKRKLMLSVHGIRVKEVNYHKKKR